MSLLPDFNLSDLIFPIEIRGCLLLANQGIDPSTWRKNRFPGWLDWIQAQKMAFLVALTGSGSPALPVDEFLGYLSLRPETQVVKLPSHRIGTSRQEHVFEITEAKHVLMTLVENIITDVLSASD